MLFAVVLLLFLLLLLLFMVVAVFGGVTIIIIHLFLESTTQAGDLIKQYLGFPGGSTDKRICLQYGRPGFDAWLGRSPGEGNGYPLQYSALENSMDCIVHGVTKSQTQQYLP